MRSSATRAPGLLRRVAGHRLLLPLTASLLRAGTVRHSGRFLVRQLMRRGAAYAYSLREFPERTVVVRHGGADPVTLGEVFHEHDYAPPPELAGFEPRRVVDLGANAGYFGVYALARWPRASVVGFEPDPANAAVHARAITLNAAGARWELRRAAAAVADGEVRFEASGDALSHAVAEGGTVVPAVDVMPLAATADLLKIDIEGGEWDLLADPRLGGDGGPAVVVLEYHPRGAQGQDTASAVRELLDRAGLTRSHIIFDRPDGHGMVWAWRP